MRMKLTLALVLLFGLALPWRAGAQALDWADVTAKARGQEVYWNAWGGDERINAYIAWVGARVQAEYGVTLRHVKLSDTAEAVRKVLAEKTAGRHQGGSVDLIWINGENFKAMKDQSLLFGPFAEDLPNFRLVDVVNKPTTRLDFTVPTDGLEAPWGMAKLNFIYDSVVLPAPPRSMAAILAHAKAHPGRVAYPAPPDFIGSTFLKQVVYETAADPAVLQLPAGDNFKAVTAPMWAYLDALTPHLWRGGKVWPKNGPALIRLLDDGEVDIAISFYPSEASSAIAAGLLPATARSFELDGGTIGNTHFVAIPYNAKAREGAMVVADFLMSAEAQARKENPEVWGDNTVLAVDRLDAAGRKLFADLPLGAATLPPEALGPILPEPHPSWMTRIEEAWLSRYGS
ncbi:MAG: ABC transporter substrate-binding protein [Alphaproteobacteria bacterium]|nr:ABC transporter substrate-binding protein [Alphaproteobacteria bacterium]